MSSGNYTLIDTIERTHTKHLTARDVALLTNYPKHRVWKIVDTDRMIYHRYFVVREKKRADPATFTVDSAWVEWFRYEWQQMQKLFGVNIDDNELREEI